MTSSFTPARVIDAPSRRVHRIVRREGDPRIVVAACGLRVAIEAPHPRTAGHLVALPDCYCQTRPVECEDCARA